MVLEQYNLTGSLPAAILGKEFSWKCSMSIPPNHTINTVSFYRNNTHVGSVARLTNGICATYSLHPRYDYRCVTDHVFSLIIPGDNMTEYENNSFWHCQYYGVGHYRSSNQLLKIAGIYEPKTESPLFWEKSSRSNLKNNMKAILMHLKPSFFLCFSFHPKYIFITTRRPFDTNRRNIKKGYVLCQ